jgi:hypothetical protein
LEVKWRSEMAIYRRRWEEEEDGRKVGVRALTMAS